MNILIINLPSSVERLSFQKNQFDSLGLTFSTVKAVSVDDLTEETFDALSTGWERPLRKSEVACFLSHKKAWETALESGQATLILEDDALLSKKTKEILDEVVSLRECDLMTLEVRSRKKIISKQPYYSSANFNVFNLYQDRTGAAAYILWPSGAEKLLNRAKSTPVGLADAFISSGYELAAFQVEPAPIMQLDQTELYKVETAAKTSSTISAEKRPTLKGTNQKSNFGFKFRRIYSQLRMAFRQISTLHKSQKRYVSVNPQDFSD